MRKSKYYLYAGYYELYLVSKPLDRPYSLISQHHDFECLVNAATKFDSDAHFVFDENTKAEYQKVYCGWVDEDVFTESKGFYVFK